MLKGLSAFRRAFALLAQHRGKVATGLASVLVFSLLHLWTVRLVGGAVDALGKTDEDLQQSIDPHHQLLIAVLLLFGVVTVGAFFRFLARKLLITASREVEATMKSQLLAHISRLPLTWYERSKTGDLLIISALFLE